MSSKSRTWWGSKFIQALEAFTDSGRLSRGRGYRTDKRVKQWQIHSNTVTAKILGNANPYFGVTKAPTYTTRVALTPISAGEWHGVIAAISEDAAAVCKLMADEMPDDIDLLFKAAKQQLLPVSYSDFEVSCTCPDYAVPCKHIAGVCYRLSEQLDSDPFLLFELRGLARQALQKQLAASPLGKVLLQSMRSAEMTPPTQSSYFTRPQPQDMDEATDIHRFWQGQVQLPAPQSEQSEAVIPALIIKKGGDYPTFWLRDSSYIEAMEQLYLRLSSNSCKFL